MFPQVPCTDRTHIIPPGMNAAETVGLETQQRGLQGDRRGLGDMMRTPAAARDPHSQTWKMSERETVRGGRSPLLSASPCLSWAVSLLLRPQHLPWGLDLGTLSFNEE